MMKNEEDLDCENDLKPILLYHPSLKPIHLKLIVLTPKADLNPECLNPIHLNALKRKARFLLILSHLT